MPDISVSSAAAEQITLQFKKSNIPDGFVRLGVKSGGCSGYYYVFQFETVAREKDLHFLSNGIRLLVDPKSIVLLDGTVLDWESSLMRRGFVFKNPQQQASCGCGLSFDVQTNLTK